jgi:endonuclease YncB( thermonuclease family)
MKRIYQILLPLLSLFLVRVELTDLFPLTLDVPLLRMIDADTMLVKYGNTKEKLRLSRIDAPEKGQPFLDGKGDAGKKAMECAKPFLRQKNYQLRVEKRDIYGRLLGDLGDLSFKLVEAGCVGLYPHAIFTSQSEKLKYIRALQRARHQGLGVWKFGGYLQPKIWRKKFSKRVSHRPKHQRDRYPRPYRPERKRG